MVTIIIILKQGDVMSKLAKLIGVTLLCTTSLFAVSKQEVVEFVSKGETLCKSAGIEACLKAFNNTKGEFIQGELYMFAYDFSGVNKALGSNPKIVGKNLYKLKDATGKELIKELINIAKTEGEGWFDYKWSHPQTKKIADKTSYIKKINDNLFIGSGFYK